MAHSLAINNPPCRVLFAGFESDTFTLGRCGWKFAMEERRGPSSPFGRLILIMNHHSGLTGFAESAGDFSIHDWRMGGQFDGHLPVFEVRGMSNSIPLRIAEFPRGFSPNNLGLVDTEYSSMRVNDYDLARLPLFRPVAQPAKEDLIIDPLTVSEMLEQIRQRQAPIQQEIRERARRREIVPIQHATIYTLPQAA